MNNEDRFLNPVEISIQHTIQIKALQSTVEVLRLDLQRIEHAQDNEPSPSYMERMIKELGNRLDYLQRQIDRLGGR